MSNKYINIIKRLSMALISGMITFGTPKTIQGANTQYKTEQAEESLNSFETEENFIENLQMQFKKGSLSLKENADKYIESIYINNHKVTLKLTSGKTYTKTLKYFNINGITVNDLWILNTKSQNYKDPSFCTIKDVTVKNVFKTDDDSISPNENVNLYSCEAIWLNNCYLLIQGRNSWQGIFNSDSLKHLIITNSHISKNFAAVEDPHLLYLNTKNLETFVLTGANSQIINIYFSNPEKLRTAIYGDNTRIRDLYGLKGATFLSYYLPGIDTNAYNFDILSITSFLDFLKTNDCPCIHTNIIENISALSDTQITSLNVESLPHAKDYMKTLQASSSIKNITGNTKYYFTNTDLKKLGELGIHYPDSTTQYVEELETITTSINEDISDYDKIKLIIKEYIKKNKLADYKLDFQNCLDLIQLFKKNNIEAYRLRYDFNNDNNPDNIVIVLENAIKFININQLSSIISSNVKNISNEKEITCGDAIDLYWKIIVENIEMEDCITDTIPDNSIDKYFINKTILPVELIEFMQNTLIKTNEYKYISYSVAGVKQSEVDTKSCMSPNFKQRVRVSSNVSKQPNKKYPYNNQFSSKAKAAR